jgi:hypothetical protein
MGSLYDASSAKVVRSCLEDGVVEHPLAILQVDCHLGKVFRKSLCKRLAVFLADLEA